MTVPADPAAARHAYVGRDTWEAASFARRSIAWLIDLALLMVVMFAVAAVFGLIVTKQNVWVAQDGSATTGTVFQLPAQWSGSLLALFSALYSIPLWHRVRATVGQALLSLRIVGVGGSKALSWRQAAIRWLLLFGWTFPVAGSSISALTWVFTFLYAAWFVVLMLSTWRDHPLGQGIHDRVARSVVERRQRYTFRASPTGADAPPPSLPPTPVASSWRSATRASRGPRRSTRGRPAED